MTYQRERLELADGDFIDLDWSSPDKEIPINAPKNRAILVFFHGLEGSSKSQYCMNTMRVVTESGWLGVVAHFRGCSGEPNRLPRSYHSGDSEHIEIVLREMRKRFPTERIFAVGVSLGGNALSKWCGEQAESAREVIDAAASVCSPLDLGITAVAILHFKNRIFNRYFMKSMGESFAQRMQQHPQLRDKGFLTTPRDFPQFDDHYTAPMHGYQGAWDYYYHASSRGMIPRIRVPFLLLNPANDPFVPAWLMPNESEVPDNVTLEQPEAGGHVGFVTAPFPGTLDWLPKRLVAFFESCPAAR